MDRNTVWDNPALYSFYYIEFVIEQYLDEERITDG
jgi:hypothetical protein